MTSNISAAEWHIARLSGVVYHKHGVVGLLRYAAVLASGGDAQLSSSSILALDLTSAENGVGESSNVSEMNGLDNLEKVILEKSFEGVNLSDSSISQLTTALRILALISDNTVCYRSPLFCPAIFLSSDGEVFLF